MSLRDLLESVELDLTESKGKKGEDVHWFGLDVRERMSWGEAEAS